MTRMEVLRQRLGELGLEPKRSLGQNFLIEDAVIQRILAAVQAFNPDAILEVGPGMGALTDDLQRLQKPLVLIELDAEMTRYWKSRELNVLEGDALQIDWQQFSDLKNMCLVSNLPYQISSSLVIDRALGPQNIESMVLMFQKEVAARIMARPKSEDYGLLSVIAQTFFKIAKVSDAAPQCFFPVPNVASRVLQFERKHPVAVTEGKAFLRFVKMAFSQRRKKMVNNLRGLADVHPQMERLNISSNARAEELSPDQFVSLFHEVSLEHQNHRGK